MNTEYFTPQNKTSTTENFSLSGKYKLVISSFKTKIGSWNYTQGEVYRVSDNTLLATIQRNYSRFPFLFIENHPKGDFLICGKNYQGQTVIDLIAGATKDFLPDSATKGHGFCWSSYTYEPVNQMLIVNGCYWAFPHEFKFFDFSDPMQKGWKSLSEDYTIDDDIRTPEILTDGTIKCYETENGYDYDPDENHRLEDFDILTTKIFKRVGDKLELIEEWVSEKEKKNRIERVEAEARWQKWQDNFYKTDPLYLTMTKCLKSKTFNTSSEYMSFGGTYEGWCPHFSGFERRACKRIAYRQNTYTIDLEWGVDAGPIKLVIFKNGNTFEDKYFEHSVDGMQEAFKYASDLLTYNLSQKFNFLTSLKRIIALIK